MTKLTLGLLGVLTVSTALTQSSAQAAPAPNGFAMNGFTMNGFTMNGFTMNGFTMNGFTMNGFTMNGFTMNGFTMNGFTMNGLGHNRLLLGRPVFEARTAIRNVSGIDSSRPLNAIARH